MKKISVNTMKSFLKERKNGNVATMEVLAGESSFHVTIRTSLTIMEKSTFISRVLSGCFDNVGEFCPEYVSPMIRATILQMCTNLPVLTLKGEKSEEKSEADEITVDLDAMNEVYLALDLDHLDDPAYQAMLGEMVHLCGQAIDWKRGRALTMTAAPLAEAVNAFGSASDAVRKLAETIIKKADSENLTELLAHAGQLTEVTKGLAGGDLAQALIQMHGAKKKA